jgi:hypothetical protein
MKQLEAIQKALSEASLPSWVARQSVQLFEDAQGELAARVSIVVHDDKGQVLNDGRELSAVRRRVHEVIDDAEIPLWPYVEFVTERDAA